MSWFFIINPGSKHHKGAKILPELLKRLDKQHIDYEYKLTKSLEDAFLFSREANKKGTQTIVAIGGDGTINQVINGFYDETGKRISSSQLGVIHTGTSPDFCLSYGIPTNPLTALDTLLKGYSRKIPIAQITFHTNTAEEQTRYFACCASFGLGAQVARYSNSGIRKYLGDSLGTFVSIVISLLRYHPENLIIQGEGNLISIENNFNTFIGKTTFIASGIKINHTLSVDDDRLYMLSLSQVNISNIIPALIAIYSGKAIKNKKYITLSYYKSIEIKAGHNNNEIEFDGDPQGFLPCRISVAQDRLELITNEPGK